MLGRGRRRAAPAPASVSVSGRARVDGRTKNLIARAAPGDIAVIDHEDIDRLSAEGLVQRQVAAVVNASPSSTGRYPNLGPLLLCTAGVMLVDGAGPGVMDIPEGAPVSIDEGAVTYRDGGRTVVAGRGEVVRLHDARARLDAAKQGIAAELERFVENTIGYIREERDVLLEGARVPDVRTDFHGRHVLVVVRGYDHKDDLRALRAYIREMKPLLVGVDGGADALIEAGLDPDMIIGDMDSVSTEALRCGAELVVHAYPGGAAPGLERLEGLGLPSEVFEGGGTSEDIAMLLAFEKGAELIVAVGTHANLIEFMDKGRRGMASTFLTRLRVGPILVDAKGLSRIYRPRVRRSDLLVLVGAALVTMIVVALLSEPMRAELQLLWFDLKNVLISARRALFG